jgi:hypothetical protein
MYFLRRNNVLFYVLFVCKCALLPPGVNPIAVKYISYIYIYIYIYIYTHTHTHTYIPTYSADAMHYPSRRQQQ